MSKASSTSLSLRARVDRNWRRMATGACFVLFALCSLAAGLLVAPMVRVISADRACSEYRIRRVVSGICRGFVVTLRALGLIDFRFRHVERLAPPGQLILANHPTLIDALFLLGYAPNASCVVKGRLASHPVTRSIIRAAGFIANNEPRAVIAAACKALENGQSLILFPEGTRSTPGQPIRLRRGGATIAVLSGAAVMPVCIRCEPHTLTKGAPWYRTPPRRPLLTLEAGASMTVATRGETTLQAINTTNCRLEAYFNDSIMDEGAHDERSGT